MAKSVRNVFISHKREDDAGLEDLKQLVERHGMTWRDYSITADNPNNEHSEEYIKREILTPRIRQASCLIVYISEKTKTSDWVDWEIEYAKKQGKRIIGVWARGAKDCELPQALDRYSDALVGWNGESIVDAITGDSDKSYRQDGSEWGHREGKEMLVTSEEATHPYVPAGAGLADLYGIWEGLEISEEDIADSRLKFRDIKI